MEQGFPEQGFTLQKLREYAFGKVLEVFNDTVRQDRLHRHYRTYASRMRYRDQVLAPLSYFRGVGEYKPSA